MYSKKLLEPNKTKKWTKATKIIIKDCTKFIKAKFKLPIISITSSTMHTVIKSSSLKKYD